MELCTRRSFPLRILVAVLVAAIGWQFALQLRDGAGDASAASRTVPNHFVSDAFPTAEASVVAR